MQIFFCFSGLTFSSGLATSTTIISLLSAGDHIVSMDDLYGGTNRFLRKIADRMNIKTTFVDARDPENVEKAIQENTKVFLRKFYPDLDRYVRKFINLCFKNLISDDLG